MGVLNFFLNFYPSPAGGPGRIRLEAYENELTDDSDPYPSVVTTPLWNSDNIDSQTLPTLSVTRVAGFDVRQPPTGQAQSPDVSFSSESDVTILVSGQNIPDGTPITLQVVGEGASFLLPTEGDSDILMNAGSATFTGTIPTGFGTIQAFAGWDD